MVLVALVLLATMLVTPLLQARVQEALVPVTHCYQLWCYLYRCYQQIAPVLWNTFLLPSQNLPFLAQHCHVTINPVFSEL